MSAERPEEDLREAQRRPQGRPPSDDRGGRVDAAGSALASKIRDLRKRVKRREVEKRSRKLKKKRDRRRATQGVREAADEARSLVGRVAGGVGALAGGAGAGGQPGARRRGRGRDEDPIARAGREAESPAPVNASLRPFGPPGAAVGPERLEMMAAGSTRPGEGEPGVASIEEFVTGRGQAARADDPVGIVGEDDLALVTSGGGDAGGGEPTGGIVSDEDLGFLYGGRR